MENKSKYLDKYGLFACLAVVCLSYIRCFQSFFAQDEWLAFADVLGDVGKNPLVTVISYFRLEINHYNPLQRIVFLTIFKLFNLNYQMWFGASLVWHLVNVVLVYKLVLLNLKRKYYASIVALLFGVSASIYQATTWVGANINTHGATSFTLISIYYFIKYGKTGNFRRWSYSIVLLIAALLFKEIAIGMFALYALILYLSNNKNKHKQLIATLATGVSFFVLRAGMLFIHNVGATPMITETQSLTDITYNLLTFPMKTVTQTVIPLQYFIKISYFIAAKIPESLRPVIGTTTFDLFAQKIILEGLSLAFFVIFSYLIYIVYIRHKDKEKKNIILFFYVYVILNSLIYALSPERFGKINVLDSRNLYLTSVGVFILLIMIVDSLFKNKKAQHIALSIVIITNIVALTGQIKTLVDYGIIRKNILLAVKASHTKLPDRVVFYTQSDTSYFGLPETDKILPFQSGLGQTLLVWYSEEKLPVQFYENKFLWEIKEEGYKEYDGRGFGYFRDKDKLFNAIKEYNIPSNAIIAYKWQGDIESLIEITDEIKKEYETNN
ncbi:hypothetical protein IPM62_04470 [Candidatus Woesebacteria bacterium]|nr:MAG: hypothetical protein IPM62_04470 [Candidatus Woesebacteria bacterium]